MSVHRITLDLDDGEYSDIVNSLHDHLGELRTAQHNDALNGIDDSHRAQDIDMVGELIDKIEEAINNGELVN